MSEYAPPQGGISKLQDASRAAPQARPGVGRRPRLWTRLVLILASTTVALACGEIGARLFVVVTHRVPLIMTDERAGWRLQPNLRDEIRGGEGGQFVINTDAEGHRLTRRRDEPAIEGKPTLLVLGDSFAQGIAVEDHETFPWILAHDLGLNVVNLGVLGYGTDQELVDLEAYLEAHPRLDVRDILVMVATNDFMDVQLDHHYLGRSKPHFRVTDGRLERPSYRLGLSDRLMDASYFYWLANSQLAAHFGPPIPDPGAGSDLVIACLAAMHDAATRRGARLHVLVHHLGKAWPTTESWWSDFRQRTGATDITERLSPPDGSNPFAYDGHHWSAAVNQRVAALIKERLAAEATP
jgi:hypothetical protein